MNNESASYEIKLKDMFSRPLGQMSDNLDSFEKKVSGVGSTLGKVFAATAIFQGIKRLGTEIVSLGAEMEQTRISFEVMLGSAKNANYIIGQIQKMASISPFETNDLLKATEQLANYGIEGKNLLGIVDKIANVAAGDKTKLEGLSRAYGQAFGLGHLAGQEKNQFINAGFNPLQEMSRMLAKQKGGSANDYMAGLMKDMEAGKILISDIENAFKTATEEGGRFYGTNERQGKALIGLWSTFTDEIKISFTKIGTDLLPMLKEGVMSLTEFVQNMDLHSYLEPVERIFTNIWTIGKNLNEIFHLDKLAGAFINALDETIKNILLATDLMSALFKFVTNRVKGSEMTWDEWKEWQKSGGDPKVKSYSDVFNSDIKKAFATRFETDEHKRMIQAMTYTPIVSPDWGDSSTSKGKQGSATDSGSGSDSAGRSSVKNITITVQKMIGINEAHYTDMKSSNNDMVEGVKRALLTVLNDANLALN